jgi:uncharacterized protein (DUF1501 family)
MLSRSLALGCSAAASPLITPIAMAAAPWDSRLIVIVLRGGMDGLDVVRPFGDPDFRSHRPGLTDGQEYDLDGFFALHPALSDLMPLWRAQGLAFVHAASTPYRNKRSHFDGQDLLEAGIGHVDQGIRDGWLNRLLAITPGVEAETAFAVGREQMLILHGDAPMSLWAPRTGLNLSPQAERLLDVVLHDDPLFRDAGREAMQITDGLLAETNDGDMQDVMSMTPMPDQIRTNAYHVQLAQFAASRLVADTRIASFSLGGWDTHSAQDRGLGNALRDLSECLLTLRAGLGPVWGKTAVVCMTEFGRTVRLNGTNGTDHGTGGAMIFAGGAVRGGQDISDWPGLSEVDLYQGRDLNPTRDVRSVAGWALRHLIGSDIADIENIVFPGVEIGPAPGGFL